MSIVFNFKSIRSKLERMEQKAEYDVNNPKPVESARSFGRRIGGMGRRSRR